MQNDRWPTELRLNPGKNSLRVTFNDGVSNELPAELLRVLSPSAEVQGHSKADKRLVTGKNQIQIVKIDMIGNYAVKLTFDDGHDTGLYSWVYFYDLATHLDEHWAEYRAEVEARKPVFNK